MPIFSAGQLIGKTFFVTRPLDFYRVSDINQFGDTAKPISNKLRRGYSFVMDSFLLPVQAYTSNSGVYHATRSNTYFTFKGHDGGYYAVIQKPDGRFSLDALSQQGAQSDLQLAQQAAAAAQTPAENFFSSLSATTKNLLYIAAGVLAAGYLLPKILKK
jgi:hypothetical protein